MRIRGAALCAAGAWLIAAAGGALADAVPRISRAAPGSPEHTIRPAGLSMVVLQGPADLLRERRAGPRLDVATPIYSLEPVEAEFQANSWVSASQLVPDVLALEGGGTAVAYNNVSVSNGYILVDFYDAIGTSIGGVARVPYALDGGSTDASTDALGAPSLAELPNGNVLVVWADKNATSPGIRGAIFTAAGDPVRGEFSITGAAGDRAPQVAGLQGVGFAVAYETGADDVRARVYDDAGEPVSGVLTLPFPSDIFDPPVPPGDQFEPAVAGLADGGFAVAVIDDSLTDAHYEHEERNLLIKTFEADGSPRVRNGQEQDLIFLWSGGAIASEPAIAGLPDGRLAAVMTLRYPYGREDQGIFHYVIDPTGGGGASSAGFLNTQGDPENESDPDITALDNSGFVASWTFSSQTGTGTDIHARILDPNGRFVALNGVAGELVLTDTSGADAASALAGLQAGKFTILWQDSRTDGSGGRISARTDEIVRATTGDAKPDVITGDAIRDLMQGNGGNDTLTGGGGDDDLDGGVGRDRMAGGAGDDRFAVDNGLDVVTEAPDEGLDTIRSTISRTLPANVENLTLLGAGNTGATGNDLDNTLIGNSGKNTLNGGAGIDRAEGGDQADTYHVESPGDVVQDTGATGVDKVIASGSYTLATGNGIELLSMTSGSVAATLVGNDLGNRLTGNGGPNLLRGLDGNDAIFGGDGADILEGGPGRDTATGGPGADTFAFKAGDVGATSASYETIADFATGADSIEVPFVGSAGLPDSAYDEGVAPSNAFAAVLARANELMSDRTNKVVFVTGPGSGDGWLFWDTDGDRATIEAGIRLQGRHSLADFAPADLS